MKNTTPWIYSPRFDLAAIIGPAVLVTSIVWIWGQRLVQITETPTWLWILLVLGIDVAHVYSSLFRTYLDKEEYQRRRTLYLSVPAICWIGGIAIYAFFGPSVFWSGIAYFAIYHFVRQQYGFLMLYRRGEQTSGWAFRIDQAAIYLATLYPLIYWHTFPRNFQWFSDFEVLRIPVLWPERLAFWVYVSVLGAFFSKEAYRAISQHQVNAGKVLLLSVTAIAWYTGIIVFNGDLTFTLINIVSHGVPYIALVWIYQYRKRRKADAVAQPWLRFFQLKYIPVYVLALMILSYFEEGIWDWFVWKEHPNLFGPVQVSASATLLMLLVPLLTTPQLTHYVLDAFIWRVSKKGKEEVRAVIG